VCASALLAAGLAALAGAQPAPAPAQGKEGPRAGTRQAQEAPAQRRPPYTALAYEEDWSDFDPALGEDFFDPIKHVDLNEDGSVWASFGGELRLRLEDWTDFLFNEDNDETFVLTPVSRPIATCPGAGADLTSTNSISRTPSRTCVSSPPMTSSSRRASAARNCSMASSGW